MKKVVNITGMLLVLLLALNGISAGATDAEQTHSVRLGGQPFGVKFYNDGVMVVRLEGYFNGQRYVCPAQDGGLKVNDVINNVNGSVIRTNEELQKAATESDGKPLEIVVTRDGKEIVRRVTPEKNTVGAYLLGAWVRDSCAGIGTVTFYDTSQHYFAALGHGICDRDTGALLPLGSAEIVGAHISSVTKGTSGSVGSLNGYFTDRSIGHLTKNTSCGVFGTIFDNSCESEPLYEIADSDQIKTGRAEMITTIDGVEPRSYEIEITRICNHDPRNDENFVIKITDNELKNRCAGIVQGMSGSPILQNGKLVGAVTHVFLNHPDEGYGVAAQFMVSNYAA